MRGSHIIAQHSIFKLLVFHRYSSSRGLSSQLIIDEKFLHCMRLITGNAGRENTGKRGREDSLGRRGLEKRKK